MKIEHSIETTSKEGLECTDDAFPMNKLFVDDEGDVGFKSSDASCIDNDDYIVSFKQGKGTSTIYAPRHVTFAKWYEGDLVLKN